MSRVKAPAEDARELRTDLHRPCSGQLTYLITHTSSHLSSLIVMPMHSTPTYRQGRKYFLFGPNDRGGCAGVCSVALITAILMIPPFLLIVSESIRHDTYTALTEVLKDDILEVTGTSIHAGDMVHAVSDFITSSPGASDPEMGVTLLNSLLLKRKTEYCQWQELQTETCQKCTRQVRAKDGSTHEEQYSCNCLISYSYMKAWRPYRINSALFNQPGAHNNPMRDPLPPAKFAAPSAILRVGSMETEKTKSWWNQVWKDRNTIQEITMDDTMIRNTKSSWRKAKWTPGGRVDKRGFFAKLLPSWWPKEKIRYESTESLKDTLYFPAATEHHFVYAGKGYFYSPYQESTSHALFKYFMEYMEGSLMDWQLGDLIPSCTAGDVRVSYQVADPDVVSVLGEVKQRKQRSLQLMPKTTTTGLEVGLVHAGIWSKEEMIAREDSDVWWIAVIFRVLAFIWSAVICRLFGALFGRNVAGANIETGIFTTVGMWCVVMGSIWKGIWDTKYNTIMTACGIAIVTICLQWYTPRTDSPPGLRAVWCIIGRWARVPPSWRMEASYPKKHSKEE